MDLNNSCDIVSSAALLRVMSATNITSAAVCLQASVTVLGLKLHRKVVYRLALYQVLASFVFSVVQALQLVFTHYSEYNGWYDRMCHGIAFLSLYTQWTKLVLMIWVTFHLFCFAVLHKNLKALEVMYVVTSLLVPALFAGAAMGIRSYGLGEFGCWIYVTCRNANTSYEKLFVERLVLWDGPAAFILLIASAAMIVMVIKISIKLQWRRRLSEDKQYWKALKQLLPLAAFPVLFYCFLVPQFLFHVYQFKFKPIDFQSNHPLYLATSVSFSLWSFSSGLTLTAHICVARLSEQCKIKSVAVGEIRDYGTIDGEGAVTIKRETASIVTSFPLPQSLAINQNT